MRLSGFKFSFLFDMGCGCGKQLIDVNGKRYTMKTKIGEGGFSTVYLVYGPNRIYYAVKSIICHSKEDERIAMQEVEYYRALKHPNLVECIDAALVGSCVGARSVSEVRILLPYYKRGTLQDELTMRAKTNTYMPEERILKLFRQMCEGIQAIHCAKPFPLAHRDVKPANVLLGDDDKPVWMDFGSMGKARIELKKSAEARALQDLAAEKCSMPYRAPELFHVESYSTVDERVDIWSLGCCLYAMCYFHSPFEPAYERGDSIALAVLNGNIELPENSPYSSGLHGLIRCLLEVDALQRPFIDGVILQIDALLPIAQSWA